MNLQERKTMKLHNYLGQAESRWLYKISVHEIITIDGLDYFGTADICEDAS